jgi:2-C-methyl-D-erythritol 4-phosphate cytidylyltransferase
MTVALIVAAGRGERLGGGRPKAFVELAGKPLLQWSLDALCALEEIARIVVALPAGERLPEGAAGAHDVSAVEGASVRSGSVARALAAAGEAETVLVHDAARPLLTPALAASVIDALRADARADAAIAAARVTDTIKRADESHAVRETLDRATLWAVQTPQVFRRVALARALEVPEEVLAQATDDAWLVERAGGRVLVVDTGPENIKVTTALDLRIAELALSQRATTAPEGRTEGPAQVQPQRAQPQAP